MEYHGRSLKNSCEENPLEKYDRRNFDKFMYSSAFGRYLFTPLPCQNRVLLIIIPIGYCCNFVHSKKAAAGIIACLLAWENRGVSLHSGRKWFMEWQLHVSG